LSFKWTIALYILCPFLHGWLGLDKKLRITFLGFPILH
jgi:hypothetical protein